MLIQPLNLSSTPIAVLSKLGLKTFAGVSSDDPTSERHFNLEMHVILSLYSQSSLITRTIIDVIKPKVHKFYCLDDEIEKLNLKQEIDLCVIHRIPAHLTKTNNNFNNAIEVDNHLDFDMYRIVVQYASNKNGMGSVIYETPPNLNRVDNKGEFLSFSNKIYISDDTTTDIILLNYSINPKHATTANVKINILDTSGEKISINQLLVKPFSYGHLNINTLIKDKKQKFYTYIATANGCSLIPLSVNQCKKNGGVSVEHSHPPQAYIMSDWKTSSQIKRNAVMSYLES